MFSMDQYLLNICGVHLVPASAIIPLQLSHRVPGFQRNLKELDLITLVGPFQFGIFHDFVLPQPSSGSPTESNGEHQQAHFLPEVLSITQNVTHKMQHELPLQVLESLGFSASATIPFLKQQPSFPFISHFNSTGPTGSQLVSSNPVFSCRV